MFAKIVVGIDSSAPSRAALSWALKRATDTGSELEIVHAVGHRFDDFSPEFSEALLGDARALLDDELRFARVIDSSVSARLDRGDPLHTLIASSATADLIVIGTHKTGFIQGRSIGSRFLALASMSACPVAFIPVVPLTSRRGVVVALDDSETGRRAVGLAVAEARRLHQNLTLLYPLPRDISSSDVTSTISDLARYETDRAISTFARATDIVEATEPTLTTKSRIARNGTARELLDASLVAALVVVAHPYARLALGTEAGSLVHDLLINLGGPLLVVPRAEFETAEASAAQSGVFELRP